MMRRARDLGFSLEQVRVLFGRAEDRDQSCETVDAITGEHLTKVNRKICNLPALRRELDELLPQCRHGRISECRIIEALGPPG